jgi:hypothetical protein
VDQGDEIVQSPFGRDLKAVAPDRMNVADRAVAGTVLPDDTAQPSIVVAELRHVFGKTSPTWRFFQAH